MGLAVLYCVGLIFGAGVPANTVDETEDVYSFEYEHLLFDESRVHSIDIRISEAAWQELKATSLQKNYYDCDLVLDGETIHHVGVRTKGNSTLVQSLVKDWDLQSLVFNFGKFNKSQRYHGLDVFSVYNNACDSSYMKEMLCMDMMRRMGVPTPLCSFTAIYLNGKYIGLYTAIEGVSESFAYRNFGGTHGQLYKPEQYDIAALLRGDPTGIVINAGALGAQEDALDISDFLQADDSAVALQYLGDDLSLYQEIWDNAVFKTGKTDQRRLVSALKRISGGEDLSESADVRELASYFAVNVFVLNTDNYLTNMAHNYYLYEKDGVLSLIPWDYDLTLGTVGTVGNEEDISLFINTAVDTPLQNTTLAERPMLGALLSDAEGYRLYHEALQSFLDECVYSGWLDAKINQYENLIYPFLTSDETESFIEATDSLRAFCELRTQSIQGQLDGVIPVTTSAQKQAPDLLVDASDFSCPDSGSLFDMLLDEEGGIALEDVLERLLTQVKLVSLFKVMRISDLKNVLAITSGENSTLDSLVESGKIQDSDRLKGIVKQGIWESLIPVLWIAASIVVLLASLIIVFRYGRKRQPTAKRRKRGNAHAV